MEGVVTSNESLTHLEFSAAQRGLIEVPSKLIRDTVGLLFDITPLSFDENLGMHRTRNWYAEKCIFTQLESDAFAVRRTKAQRTNGEHLLYVHRYVDGYLRGRIGDFNIDREPGSIYILDQASNVECVQRPATMQGILMPKSAIGFDHDDHPPLTKIPTHSGLGKVLETLFDQIFEGLLSRNSVAFASFNQLIACLKLGLGAAPENGDIRAQARLAIRQSISQHVEQKLDHWELGVDSILNNFGVSRASLYRLFEDRGGVRQFISDRRLLRAVLDITKGPLLRGEIAETAERWGFSSAANFNRAIRREFGVPPGSLINLPEDEVATFAAKRDLRAFRETADVSVMQVAHSDLLVSS